MKCVYTQTNDQVNYLFFAEVRPDGSTVSSIIRLRPSMVPSLMVRQSDYDLSLSIWCNSMIGGAFEIGMVFASSSIIQVEIKQYIKYISVYL